MESFKYVSLFSGIGGFEQGLNSVGGKCVLASEIDRFANQSYEALYGDKTVGDITKVDAKDVPDHDVLVGGFPCQAFSVAGLRKGYEDSRGTLFFEVARIAKEKQPKMIMLENVKGLISHDKGKTLDVIIATLFEVGYTVDFKVLNSKVFGVPQNRERIFICAIRDDLIEPVKWTKFEKNVTGKARKRVSEMEGNKTFNFDWPLNDSVTTRLRDVLEKNVDEKHYLSNDKTSKLIQQLDDGLKVREATIKGYAMAYEGDSINIVLPNSKTRRGRVGKQIANALVTGLEQTVVEAVDPIMLGHVDVNGHDYLKRVYSVDGVANTLSTMGGGGQEPKIAEPQISIIGHSGSGGQKGYIYESDGIMSCLTATDYKQPKQIVEPQINVIGTTKESDAKGTNSRQWVYEADDSLISTIDATTYKQPKQIFGEITHYRIRRLTPLECWLLQGFTKEQHDTVKSAGISDSQRYKQAGNAVTVNVIKALGEKLIAYL